MNDLERLDAALLPEQDSTSKMGLMVGSITFAPDKHKPAYCSNCITAQQEVERLRIGNAAVVRENHRLQRDLAGAMLRINDLENKQFVGRP